MNMYREDHQKACLGLFFSDIVTKRRGALICISMSALEDDCRLDDCNELNCMKQL